MGGNPDWRTHMIPNCLRRLVAPGVFLLVFVAFALWATAERTGQKPGNAEKGQGSLAPGK